jgi:hypothetical protein
MPERLNPRVLQNDLLVEVLDNFGPEITTGRFPPFKLLEKLGGITALPVVVQDELANRNPQNFQRWAAFLELYDGTGKIANLDERLRAAFEVPEIPGAGTAKAPDPVADAVIADAPAHAPVGKEDRLIAQWIGGDGLDQTVATNLRLLVFSAVSNAIDWDMVGLAKASFTGKTGKPFQTASISFDRQTTQVRSDLPVKLVIPGDLVRPATAAAALQGVLRASKDQFRWEFPDGEKMLAAFLDCVEIWARSVEAQLRRICQPTPQWNQAAAATELLCVGAAIGGRIKADASIADMIDAAFSGNWAPECASTAPEMKSLYATLSKNREKLADIARSQMSSMKGGQARAMLNPGRILGPIRNFRQAKYQLRLQPPDGDSQEPAKTYRDIRDAIPGAATAEMIVRQSWLDAMEAAFGVTSNRASILNSLDAAVQAVADAGIGTNNTARLLKEELERFRSVQFDDSVLAARALAKEPDAIAALPQFGRGRRSAVEAGTALAAAAQAFLDAVDENIGANSQSLDAKHGAVAASLDQIDTSLTAIEADLIAMTTIDGEQADAA